MSASFEFSEPDRFVAGTVGEPGERTFFLQLLAGGELVSLKCEKQQVGALAEHLASILVELADPAPAELAATDRDFVAPPAATWTLGRMGVAWDPDQDRLVLLCEELVDDETADPDDGPASVRFRLTRAQVTAFVEQARLLVRSGRPPCVWCGLPDDARGHFCPRMN